MYFLIFERSPLTKTHLSYKSLSRIQDSDNGVPGTGISCFALKFNRRSRRKREGGGGGGGGGGGEEERERKTTTKVKGRSVFEKRQTEVFQWTKQRIHTVNKLKTN